MYLEPVPLNSESEPPLTLISARVKSEEDSESSNSMRADSPTISLEELELIAMVGRWCPWRCNGEGENYCCHCHLC